MGRKESIKKYNDSHKEEHKQYYLEHKEEILAKRKAYYLSKEGKLKKMVQAYKQQDKEANRGESTLNYEQLLSLIEQGCHWCGEKDWTKLGADRIDNTKPHTIDNCVCSCLHCNAGRERQKKVFQYTLDGEFVAEYRSESEASRQTGINQTHINGCCNHKYGFKTAKNFIFVYENEREIIYDIIKEYNRYKDRTKIIQLSKDGVFINEYQSATEANRILGIDSSSIIACCRGKRKTAGGSIWKYLDGAVPN